jgi:hypothetical protein
MMELSNYFIDHASLDEQALLRNWSWLLPENLSIWIMNTFGDLFVVLDDGSVHRLTTDGGELEKLAESREHFEELMLESNNANTWLLIPLVDKVVSSGKQLEPGKCFGYKIPPVAGGKYEPDNIAIKSIKEYHSFLGYFYEKIKDLPNGAKIQFKIVD